ncbi:MAG TPA: haloacid dehalogenase type II [Burkholderiales bacterium]|nr:haloacid dehalogenase type II [Burkholderiales bacterium]
MVTHSALVFDAYGTLFDVHSVLARCDAFWPGRGAQLSQLWRAKQLEYTWQRSLMGRYAPFSQVTEEALLYSCEFLKLEIRKNETRSLMDEYRRLALYPDVKAAMGKFKTKLAILTNGSPDMIDPLVAQSGLSFDAVLSVDEMKIYKPAPQVYQLAVDRLKTPKESIGFVSSNCWDAMGAKSFGFGVYWINRGGAPVDRLGFTPDKIVKSLGEILL